MVHASWSWYQECKCFAIMCITSLTYYSAFLCSPKFVSKFMPRFIIYVDLFSLQQASTVWCDLLIKPHLLQPRFFYLAFPYRLGSINLFHLLQPRFFYLAIPYWLGSINLFPLLQPRIFYLAFPIG